MIVTAGSTDVSVYYYIVQDASATSPGEPATGLLFSDIETGGSASYARQGAARVDLELITLASASAAHADGGFILVDDTNMPGLYRCDYPDAAFATGVDQVFLQIVVASANNAIAAPILVDITDVDLRDSVRGGMTALPNAAADAAGGLPISDTGGLDLDTQLAETDEITAARMGALTDWINGGRLDLILDIIAADTTTDIPALIATAQADLDIITGATGVNLLNATQASIDAIEIDTNELQVDWTNGGRLDLILDIIAVDTTTDIPALIATTQADLDIITGADGVNLLSATQATIDDTNTVVTTTSISVDKIPKSDGTVTWNATALASINGECDTALTDYDGPTNAEMVARTLLASAYFDPTTDAVANVTLVATTTTNTDMRGTDSAFLAASAPSNFSSMVISAAGITDANAQQINSVDVIGAGIAADLWRA